MEQTQYEKLSLINGRVHTQSGTASNITFEHGRIVSIDDELSGIDGKIIDLHGRTVLPAFCDTGLDFLSWAEDQERLNLSSINTAKEFIDSLTTYVRANPKPLRGWYIGYDLPGKVIISRDDIDGVIPSTPCAVVDEKSNHAVLNTPAMNAFNMPQDNVELDEFFQHLPDLSEEDITSLIRIYAPKINAMGISEVWGDFYGDGSKLWDIFCGDAYDLLTFRLRCNFGFNEVNTLNEFLSSGLRTGDGIPFCKLGGILVKDGLDQQKQNSMIYSAHLSGCQVISDNNKSCLNALERVIKRSRKNLRHLIRVRTMSTGLIERIRLSGVGLGCISIAGDGDELLHEAFQNGLVVSAGSGDEIISPLKNISLMVSHGLSVSEALSIYTWGASWNGSNDSRRGELTVGNDADIVILEQDPFLVRPEEIAGIDVSMTFSAGCAVYDSGAI